MDEAATLPHPDPAPAPSPDASPDELVLRLPTDPGTTAAVRRSLRAWLRAHRLGPDSIDDVVLATSELIDNAVEHAFPPGSPGQVRLAAHFRRDRVTVVVADTGTWRPPHPAPTDRGRGLAMIHRLADDVSIVTSGPGTRVTATFRAVAENP